MAQTAHSNTSESNTNISSAKRISASKYWCFTWNNYPLDALDQLALTFRDIEWIAGREVGEECQTPHLQGYVEFPEKIRPMEKLGLPKQIHWEKRFKGSSKNACACYCAKEGDYHGTIIPIVRKNRPMPKIELSGWQIPCSDAFLQEPDNRSVYWYWSEEGATGKSTMVRWMAMRGALVCAGKAADMKYQIIQYQKQHDAWPDAVVFDVPRSAFRWLSYAGIEEIKNGVFASSKYESDMVVMPHPHVFVFCNFEPSYQNEFLSSDRIKETQVWACG